MSTRPLNAIGSAVLVWALVAQPVLADGLTVTPTSYDTVISSAQQSVTMPVMLRNDSAESISLTLRAIDFGALDETGGLAFLGSNLSDYPLTPYLSIDQASLTLAPGSQTLVNLLVSDHETLAPGGHYGAVLAEQIAGAGTGSSVQGSVAALFYITKQGGERYSLDLVSASPVGWSTEVPTEMTLRLRAGGNTHVIPRGTVLVSNRRGEVVARGVINEGSAAVLPQSIRRYKTLLTIEHPLVPGKYQIKIEYSYAGGEPQTAYFDYVYCPAYLPIAGALCLFLIWRAVIRHRAKK